MQNYKEQPIKLDEWINNATAGSKSVVELGAGFFNRLAAVNESVTERTGIEIWQPYIDNAKFHNCTKIQGDILKYREILEGEFPDTCMIVDVLEHFDMDVAKALVEQLKDDFAKIILMIPCGLYAQDRDVTGHGAHEHQTHKSYWYDEDIMGLGFHENIKDPNFHTKNVSHGHDTACYFCTWERSNVT